jgi:hypothetical protein
VEHTDEERRDEGWAERATHACAAYCSEKVAEYAVQGHSGEEEHRYYALQAGARLWAR